MSKQTSMIEFFGKDTDDFWKRWKECTNPDCVSAKDTHYHQIGQAAPAVEHGGHWKFHNNCWQWISHAPASIARRLYRQQVREERRSNPYKVFGASK